MLGCCSAHVQPRVSKPIVWGAPTLWIGAAPCQKNICIPRDSLLLIGICLSRAVAERTPVLLAIELGLFEEAGFDVTLQIFNGGVGPPCAAGRTRTRSS